MSLDDSLFDGMFDGMFHGDGSDRRPGKCFCGEDTSDVEEALCRRCLRTSLRYSSPKVQLLPNRSRTWVCDLLLLLLLCFSSSTGCNHANSHCGTSADCSGYAVPTYPCGDRFSIGDSPSNSTVQRSGNRKTLTEAQAAKKKLTDRQSQKRRIGKMRALQSENEAHQATIKRQEKKIRGLTASLQREVGGRSNANSTTRGGLHEHLLITHYDNWQSVKFALEQAYCHEDGSPQLAQRSLFQDEAGEVKVAGRFMWNQLGHEPFGGLVQLQEYAKHLVEAGNGRLLFRCEGQYGRGMQILDSGDCMSPNPLGECERTYLHRDWDNNRLNSLTIILALANDVMGYVIRNDKGELEEATKVKCHPPQATRTKHWVTSI